MIVGSAVYQKINSGHSGKTKKKNQKTNGFYLRSAGLLGEFLSILKEDSVGQTRVLMEEIERRAEILAPWKYSAEVLGVRMEMDWEMMSSFPP